MLQPCERLQQIRRSLDLNQKEMAVYAGVSVRTMNTWMTGERKCSEHVLDLIERIAEADMESTKYDLPTSPMMRWAVISERDHTETITFCGSKTDALRAGQADWDHLTAGEKERTNHHAVALLKAQFKKHARQPFQQYEDLNGNIDADWYEVAKEWK